MADGPKFQSLDRCNSAVNCSTSLKSGIEFNHVTADRHISSV